MCASASDDAASAIAVALLVKSDLPPESPLLYGAIANVLHATAI